MPVETITTLKEEGIERRSMLTVTHALSFKTVNGQQCDTRSDWFKHPHSIDDYWWQLAVSRCGHKTYNLGLLVERESNLNVHAASEILDFPFIVCASECKIFKRCEGSLPTVSRFLMSRTSYGVYRITVTRKCFRILRLKLEHSSEISVVISLTLLNDKYLHKKMMHYALLHPSTVQEHQVIQQLEDVPKGEQILPEDKNFHDLPGCTDLILVTKDGQTLGANKAILTENSPVFRAMFTHDTIEKRNSKIVMPDVSFEVMREVLRFLHTSSANFEDLDVLVELADVSERFDLAALKSRIESTLISSLYKENRTGWCDNMLQHAAYLLNMANMYNMAELQEACQMALAWNIRFHDMELLKLSLETKSDLLKVFTFERLASLRYPHFDEAGYEELREQYPELTKDLLVAQIHAHGCSPGISYTQK